MMSSRLTLARTAWSGASKVIEQAIQAAEAGSVEAHPDKRLRHMFSDHKGKAATDKDDL